MRELGEPAQRELVARFIAAWQEQDAGALASLMTDDVKFSMPPLPCWFDGRSDVVRFFAERVFATPWVLRPLSVSCQLALACYQGPDFRLGALGVLTLRGSLVAEVTGFLDPALHGRFSLPAR